MDLRVIRAYLDRKRLSARASHNDIRARLVRNLVGHNTITHYLRRAKSPLSTEEASGQTIESLSTTPMK
jgi:hypothetical protein